MTGLTRRVFLVRGVLGLFLSTFGAACTFLKQRAMFSLTEEQVTGLSSTEFKVIQVCLDLLIPADDTPSATTLDVDIQLRDEVDVNPQIKATLREGVFWLTYKAMERGRGDFSSLDETEQIALLTLAEMADPGSIEQLFFSCLRNRAFYHYYASPSAFNIPGYHTSPQPVGYPGHSKPITEQP